MPVDQRITLTPRQRDRLLLAWHELSRAHKRARQRSAEILEELGLSADQPGRLDIGDDGSITLVVRDAEQER